MSNYYYTPFNYTPKEYATMELNNSVKGIQSGDYSLANYYYNKLIASGNNYDNRKRYSIALIGAVLSVWGVKLDMIVKLPTSKKCRGNNFFYNISKDNVLHLRLPFNNNKGDIWAVKGHFRHILWFLLEMYDYHIIKLDFNFVLKEYANGKREREKDLFNKIVNLNAFAYILN